ncbi:LytTR family DNA-binding domain-containing protein [Runella sp. MFBS21]|uniref:LytR/AlgR family response regulator transcription factor n=1 Tax=Runella sp. MFBS21 TaxID=3034018 RepID=UPI0023F70119|nr:LytTR family DNA-binding domain-containing protein [Runella sp. MFBS21]MDF7819753.1 LytTR family DNA-binding domain-containing protein [Runella sp. MFBS21]
METNLPSLKPQKLVEKTVTEEIVHIEGDGNYSRVVMLNGRFAVVTQNIQLLHQNLPPQFIRIHKSYVINVQYLAKILARQKMLLLTNGMRLPIARRRYTEVKNIFKNYQKSA